MCEYLCEVKFPGILITWIFIYLTTQLLIVIFQVMISMNLCLLVGLAVDYVVHLAEGYHLSFQPSRRLKAKDTLDHLGVSVLCGAGTTLGAAFFMLFGKIQFFLQFGTFLFCTIGFALLFSLCFFINFMALFGPQGNTGSLRPLIFWLKVKLTGKLVNMQSKCVQTDENSSNGKLEDLEEPLLEENIEEVETSHL